MLSLLIFVGEAVRMLLTEEDVRVTELLLKVEDLSVAFRQGGQDSLAVDRISFHLDPGETVAIVGESGSGKSVSALSILKLLPYPAAHHPSGKILFKRRDLLARSENRAARGARQRHHDGLSGADDVA
jgi:microcin C transport system ATP-binding protein